jgi:hypothetical protein
MSRNGLTFDVLSLTVDQTRFRQSSAAFLYLLLRQKNECLPQNRFGVCMIDVRSIIVWESEVSRHMTGTKDYCSSFDDVAYDVAYWHWSLYLDIH